MINDSQILILSINILGNGVGTFNIRTGTVNRNPSDAHDEDPSQKG